MTALHADRFVGWPADARALVERACERHGGWRRFEGRAAVAVELEGLGGLLPRLRGLGFSWQAPRRVLVEPAAGRTTFLDYPGPGSVGVYRAGGVRLERAGEVLFDSPAHRARMPLLPWGPADALYFFGYALLDYLSLPFLLADCRFVGADRASVTVDMPPGRDTHCARQRFWFDEDGLLVRHDYRADVIGRAATGAHATSDYVDVDGVPFARRRRVTVRFGSLATPLPVLEARMGAFRVTHVPDGGGRASKALRAG